jgi:hypothetical protein
MVISSMKATVLLGSLMMLSLPLPKEGSAAGPAGHAPQVDPKPVKVTGCLQKGDEENEFVITDKAGKKYEITSKSVALADHVGHTVTVKGTTVAKEKGEKEAAEEKGEKGEKAEAEEAKEHEGGHLKVTSLTMVSPKCK